MKRWIPSPLLFGLIVSFWLLMVSEFSLQQVLMGVVLAIAIPPFAARLDREFARIGSVRPIPKLVVVLLWDILMCNLTVARQVLGRETDIHPSFIWYPLEIQNIHAIAALTSFITLTPGTVSAALSDDRQYLLIHVFSLEDRETLIADIKRRYENPLKEIFP